MRLPFNVTLAEYMSQRKIGEIFRDLPNLFSIANDILIVGYDVNGADHDRTLCRVLQIHNTENLKLNTDNAT